MVTTPNGCWPRPSPSATSGESRRSRNHPEVPAGTALFNRRGKDLARATGQDDQLDVDAAIKALEFLVPIDEAIRRPGGFGPKLVAPSYADAQTQLPAFAGRRA